MKRRLTTDQKSYVLSAQRHHCACGCGELVSQGRTVFVGGKAYLPEHRPMPRRDAFIVRQAQREGL